MFQYKVKYWDEDEKCTLTEVGLVGATKWGKAARKLEEYYGRGNIYSIELTPLDDVMYAEESIEAMQTALTEK